MIEQAACLWKESDGAYDNAWKNNYLNSIDSWLIKGWVIKHMIDRPEKKHLWILFERAKMHLPLKEK